MPHPRPVMLIAGAGPGMGRRLAELAAQRGFDLTLAARRAEHLEETAALVEGSGAAALVAPADLSEPAGAQRVADLTLERFGRLDVLVHSLLPPHLLKRVLALEDAELEAWRKSVEVSTFGALLMARAAARPMVQAGRGAMVFVTATSGLQGYPSVSAHAVGKAGIHALMQCLASELGPSGVRANAVAVGVLEGATRRSLPPLDPQVRADLESVGDPRLSALRRHPSEQEAAEAALYLASEAAAGVTGQILAVDGGRHFH